VTQQVDTLFMGFEEWWCSGMFHSMTSMHIKHISWSVGNMYTGFART